MSAYKSSSVLACAGVCALALSSQAAAIDRSQGVYRIPYTNGTEVEVSNDHIDHDPPGRIDMHGESGGPYKIVAAADGVVRFVVDGFNKRLDCDGLAASEKKNNYVWIEHPNGEWTKYTHMRKGSSSNKAKLFVGKSVKTGDYLGDEGEVGCASGEHLHFEVGVPKNSTAITTVGGYLTDNTGSKRNRIPRICGISGGIFVSDESYTARKVPGRIEPGSSEVARHGVPARDYQCLFDQAVIGGYMPDWIDGFDVDGKIYYNVVFRPNTGVAWQAFHGLTATQYQQRFDEYTDKGYRPYLVESYRGDDGVRYAAIFRKQSGPSYSAYHGLTAAEHQNRMDTLSESGFRPRNVSVVSVGGQRRYTALYEKTDIGSWQSKSQMTASQYQQLFDTNAQAGRQVVYLNAYRHDGQAYYSAIWSSKASGAWRARHGLTSAQYQNEWESATGAGLSTRNVTAYGQGDSARYAGIWR
ncbi:peptidoglycan DD-metalloendopeptidase family protein [Luteimonas panaciterrae]|uniref:peptidoglycan DD-metalloendopeptidase family protein n=1 Tax=Luteimonas panaciterrae TaxID=363885 RepID=UPI001CFC1BFA|nr:peptidoglycan DD-metalloendopeptidase family protein [Luteimonas panaciterrae]